MGNIEFCHGGEWCVERKFQRFYGRQSVCGNIYGEGDPTLPMVGRVCFFHWSQNLNKVT